MQKEILIVYNANYNYYAPRFFPHPFIPDKARQIFEKLNIANRKLQVYSPDKMVSMEQLEKVQDQSYLLGLDGKYVSQAIDFPGILKYIPQKYIDSCLLDPMRWQVSGTLLATKLALEQKSLAITIGGGYHHARERKGYGGCIFADIPLAIEEHCKNLRVGIVDLDAHQGDGLEEYVKKVDNVWMMDMFNCNEFPFNPDGLLDDATENVYDVKEKKILKIPLIGGYLSQELFGKREFFGYSLQKLDPLFLTETVHKRRVNDSEYLTKLKANLERFLDNIEPDIVFYNAGSDPYRKDPWGCMNISRKGLFERDLHVWSKIEERNIPMVMTLSGGYSPNNPEVVSQSLTNILQS